MQVKALPGFREFYPPDAALRNHIFSAWRTVATRYGFEEYDGPPLEPLELYTQKSGPEIVSQLFEFIDKGDRHVALRPEMTPTLARMVTARAPALKKPIRWFSIPQLFRYEKQQKGRLREHFQLNMDLIGEPGPLADAEIIAAAIDIQRALGLGTGDVRVRVSDRRLLTALIEAAGFPEDRVSIAYEAIDKIERVPREELLRRLREAVPAGGNPAAAERVLALAEVRGRGSLDQALGRHPEAAPASEELIEAIDALDSMGLGEFIEIDLSIVRGLAYYTGIVFELFDAQRSLRAICGGGRYDGLLKALGGVDLPAVGFGMGDVVLGELLKSRSAAGEALRRLDAFLVAVTVEDRPTVLALAHALRDRGLSIEFALKEQAVARQLRIAASRPAKRAVVIGPDERKQGAAVVRDMSTGTEERVPVATLADYLAGGTAGDA
ncbi:MAG: histidine--tRNA ligase [Gemmatimonadetes bacterium]|nr:histidine--tRNA ligase [Gemmatimonadota bacterium]